jgi:hypothetical protein
VKLKSICKVFGKKAVVVASMSHVGKKPREATIFGFTSVVQIAKWFLHGFSLEAVFCQGFGRASVKASGEVLGKALPNGARPRPAGNFRGFTVSLPLADGKWVTGGATRRAGLTLRTYDSLGDGTGGRSPVNRRTGPPVSEPRWGPVMRGP